MTEPTIRPHGCHNHKAFVEAVIVQHGWSEIFRDGFNNPHRTPVLKEIPNPMTKDCQYTLHKDNHADPRCAGCFWQRQPPIAVLAA